MKCKLQLTYWDSVCGPGTDLFHRWSHIACHWGERTHHMLCIQSHSHRWHM